MDPLGMFLESLCHWFHWFVTTTITGMDDLGAWMGLPETNRQHFAPKNRALKAPPKGTESSHPPSNFQGQTGWIPFGDMPQNLKHKAHWDCRKVDLQLSWGIPALWWNTALFLLGEWLMGFLHHLFEKKKGAHQKHRPFPTTWERWKFSEKCLKPPPRPACRLYIIRRCKFQVSDSALFDGNLCVYLEEFEIKLRFLSFCSSFWRNCWLILVGLITILQVKNGFKKVYWRLPTTKNKKVVFKW